jgi:hypothetical protein
MASVIDRHSITATIDPLAIELAVIEGSLSLDESRAPYAEMQLIAAFPSDLDLELIDITAQPLRVSGESPARLRHNLEPRNSHRFRRRGCLCHYRLWRCEPVVDNEPAIRIVEPETPRVAGATL